MFEGDRGEEWPYSRGISELYTDPQFGSDVRVRSRIPPFARGYFVRKTSLWKMSSKQFQSPPEPGFSWEGGVGLLPEPSFCTVEAIPTIISILVSHS